MEYIERTTRYPISEYRLMQKQKIIDTELARGSIDVCIAARETHLVNGANYHDFYIQMHCPNGHPEFPGMGGCWVKYNILGSN